MHVYKSFLIACASVVLFCIGWARTVSAETRVTDGFLGQGAVWDASGSPYVLADTVTVPVGQSLHVGPGTKILADSALADDIPFLYVNGSLFLEGDAAHPISIEGISGITTDHGTTSIAYADIDTSDGLTFIGSFGTIATSTIEHAFQGINVRQSTLNVVGSRLVGNHYGIVVQAPGGPALALEHGDDQLYGRGGLGNVFGPELALDTSQSSWGVSVSGSAIVGNTGAAIKNTSMVPVQAIGNWWGSTDGPLAATSSKLIGPIVYDPWLDHDPTTVPVCCSSVLFIPGLEGSRLYASPVNQLWEPHRNNDVRGLFLNQDGSSVDPTVYAGKPIDSALGVVGVYARFMDFLDGLSRNGMINEWKAFGYDWRKPIAEVVAGPEKRATTTESLIDAVEQLAARSKTGKVTIVAHSNGGLVAKYLIKTLVDMGRAGLVSSLISVAVPYIGTSQAILGLLHGAGQAIAAGLILKQSVARQLGANMPSAYSLLPSRAFFTDLVGPVIAFASTTVRGVSDDSYPQRISSFDGQSAFIAGIGDMHDVRPTASSSDTGHPIRGNSLLMTDADVLHGIIDPFIWPSNIARWAISGWDALTASGLSYAEKTHCVPAVGAISCFQTASPEPITTVLGDGTVMSRSAAYQAGTVISFDLKSISASEGRNIRHSNILESSTTQSVIADLIQRGADQSPPALPTGVQLGEPGSALEPALIMVSTHSPVELHIYDSHGRHTGLTALPSDATGSDALVAYEEGIPGSGFMLMGDEQSPDTYIAVPDNGDHYTAAVRGLGLGRFTYRVERRRGDQILDSVEYTAIPVTPGAHATTTFAIPPSSGGGGGTGVSLSASVAPIGLDTNNDGVTDIVSQPGTSTDPVSDTEAYRKFCQTLSL